MLVMTTGDEGDDEEFETIAPLCVNSFTVLMTRS